MKRSFSFFLFWFVITTFVQGQTKEYVVISVKQSYKFSPHGTQTYFWIVPVDSITTFKSNFSHLFLSDFSLNNQQDCCVGNPIDPFVVNDKSNFELGQPYMVVLDELKSTILKNRRKLQKITKKWEDGQSQTIQIYATAILGDFCCCSYDIIGQNRTGYRGKVYIPKSSFSKFHKFWDMPKAKYLLKQDFSRIEFDIIPK